MNYELLAAHSGENENQGLQASLSLKQADKLMEDTGSAL